MTKPEAMVATTKHKFLWLNRCIITGPAFCLCLSEKEYHQALDHIEMQKDGREPWIQEDKDAQVHFFIQGRKRIRIVCFNDNPLVSLAEVYGLLLHEAVHIWQYICEDMGERYPGKEVEAYSIQHIAIELIEEYMRRKRLPKYGRRNR